ncbi:hypothetical protein AB0F81_09190 [Actinoplanes sp. NPDC024001]|uniref:hypothetical protein n=1 Tax=Actinoplanes sp. NPDC024001 TaxID=3154598 RepID=UPI0033E05C18
MSIESALADPGHDSFETALTDAVHAGPRGERALLAALAAAPDEDHACDLVAALGEADGPDGPAILRAVAVDPNRSAPERCAALIALAKRSGPAAGDVCARALADPDESIRDYALLALAAAGDDRAWAAVLAELERLLQRPADPDRDLDERTLSGQSTLLTAVCYLGRHAATDPQRQRAVTGLVRRRWDRVHGAEQRWLTVHWPACDPNRPDTATTLDATWLTDWISWPMFSALFPRG